MTDKPTNNMSNPVRTDKMPETIWAGGSKQSCDAGTWTAFEDCAKYYNAIKYRRVDKGTITLTREQLEGMRFGRNREKNRKSTCPDYANGYDDGNDALIDELLEMME